MYYSMRNLDVTKQKELHKKTKDGSIDLNQT
jgi:hypothetical protein